MLAAWDWRNGQLTSRWVFDSGVGVGRFPWPGASPYSGQGNHNLSVADVDADGKDEIVYGSMIVDDNGEGLLTTGLRHGDALHVSDMVPSRPGLEVFGVHESEGQTIALGTPGMALYDAHTGQVIWSALPGTDVGRGMAADIDPRSPGYEFWGASSVGLVDGAGQRVADAPSTVNHAVWWDADLLRELEDSNWISKWDWNTSSLVRLLTATGAASNNGTKANAALTADLFGDWREEVIWRTSDNTALRIYSTTALATNRIYTLMHDPQYRARRSPGRTSHTTSRLIPDSSLARAWRTRRDRTSSIATRQAPAFKSLTASTRQLWPANHKMVAVSLSVELVDLIDPAPTARIVGVSSNEPVDGDDDGHTSPDWEITGPLTVQLRAERSGTGTGRVYTIEVEGIDAAGNITLQTISIGVPVSGG